MDSIDLLTYVPQGCFSGGGTLQWHHNKCHGVSNQQHLECLISRLFRSTSKKTSKLHVSGPCKENQPVTGGIPWQRASNAEYGSIWWRHRGQLAIINDATLMYMGKISRRLTTTNKTVYELYGKYLNVLCWKYVLYIPGSNSNAFAHITDWLTTGLDSSKWNRYSNSSECRLKIFLVYSDVEHAASTHI